jgi:hypothetical protein
MRITKLDWCCSILIATTILVLYLLFVDTSTAQPFNNTITTTNQNHHIYNDDILLFNIYTVPEIVHVGDTFIIKATIANDSPNSITFLSDVCNEQQLSVQFTNNNVIKQFKNPCNALPAIITLNPGENMTLQAPGSHGILYRATAASLTNATLTFYYKTPNLQGEKHIVQKHVVFDILQ